MQNILEITNQLGIGGTEKTMQIYSKYLDKSKFNVYVCGLFEGGVRANLIKSYSKDFLLADRDLDKVKKFVEDNKIDIVHWHSITRTPCPAFYKSLELLKFFKSKGIKIIETSPFSLFQQDVDDLIDLKLFVSKSNLFKYLWKFGDKIKDKSKCYYLYNPLDIDELQQYKLSELDKIELRKKYNISEDAFVLGKVGRASLWKWDDAIIDVVPYLIDQIPNLKIVIRAIPEYKKQRIKSKGIEKYFVYLPESVNEKEISETYQLMDVLLHTSRIGESAGIAIYEGMFFGLPIITKSTDFMKFTLFDRDNGQLEIVKDGINGFVENDIKKIAQRVIELYKDEQLRQKISINNQKKVMEVLDAKILVKKLESIFEGNFSKDFDLDISSYKKDLKNEGFLYLVNENIKAIYEKIFYKC